MIGIEHHNQVWLEHDQFFGERLVELRRFAIRPITLAYEGKDRRVPDAKCADDFSQEPFSSKSIAHCFARLVHDCHSADPSRKLSAHEIVLGLKDRGANAI